MLHHCKPFTQGRLRAPVMASNVCASLHMQERTQMSAASIEKKFHCSVCKKAFRLEMAAKVHVQQAHNGEAVIEAGAGPGQADEKIDIKVANNGPPTEPVSLKTSLQSSLSSEESSDKDKWVPKWKRPTPKPLYESAHELPADVMSAMLETWDTVGLKRLGQTFVHSSMVMKVAAAADTLEGQYNGRTSSSRIPTMISPSCPAFPFATQPGFSPITSVGQAASSTSSHSASPYGQLPMFGETPAPIKPAMPMSPVTPTVSEESSSSFTSASATSSQTPSSPLSPFAASVSAAAAPINSNNTTCVNAMPITSPFAANHVSQTNIASNIGNNNSNNNVAINKSNNNLPNYATATNTHTSGVVASPFTSTSSASFTLSSKAEDDAAGAATSPFAGVPSFSDAVLSPFADVAVSAHSTSLPGQSPLVTPATNANHTNVVGTPNNATVASTSTSTPLTSANNSFPSSTSSTTTGALHMVNSEMFPEGLPPSPFLDPNSPATAVAMPNMFMSNNSAMSFGAFNTNSNNNNNPNQVGMTPGNMSMDATCTMSINSSMFMNSTHMPAAAPEPVKYECEQCGKTFTTHDGMRMHSKAKHNVDVPPQKVQNRNRRLAAEEELLDLPTYIPSPVDLSLTTPFGKKEITEVWADVEIAPYTHMMSNTTIVGLISDVEIIDNNSMNLIIYIADEEYDTRKYTKVDECEDASANHSNNNNKKKCAVRHGVNPTKANPSDKGEKLTVHCTGFFSEMAQQSLRRNDTVFVNGTLRLLRHFHMNRYYTLPVIHVTQPFGLIAKVG